jgi:hypothetical protein
MQKHLCVLTLLAMLLLVVPLTVNALGLDIEAKAGGGVAMGTTDNESTTGALRWAAGAGLNLDLYLLTVGKLALGLSAGTDYTIMNFHGVTDITFPIVTVRTSDSTYNYLIIPAALAGKISCTESLSLIFKLGGYMGYFLGGVSDLRYSPEGGPFVNGEVTLDSSNTEQWQYGLHFCAGADFALKGKLSFSPSLQFDMGLTDTSVNNPLEAFKDTFWALTANVGIKYKAF